MNAAGMTIGLDLGSLSCRGVLAAVTDGTVLAEAEAVYPHGVLAEALPSGCPLPPLWALQHPEDHLQAAEAVIRELMAASGAAPEQVLGIGLAATASTVIPVDKQLRPLCLQPRFSGRPHAWPKMWKHHAAFREAEALTAAAEAMKLPALDGCGGKVGQESLLPKVLQVYFEDRGVFEAAETFMELGDYIASALTGTEVRGAAALMCKSLWTPDTGYPPDRFFAGIDGGLSGLAERKLAFHNGARPAIAWPGQRAGGLSAQMAGRLGLKEGTAVASPQLDAYAGVPGCGVSGPGTLVMMAGTSTSFLLMGPPPVRPVPGICNGVEGCLLEGLAGYTAGQASSGDILAWFVDNCVPGSYTAAAAEAGRDIHGMLTELAAKLRPGESGLLALDWWNGNKSCLGDPLLSGLILGLNLRTKPEQIYRALLEATAFGARVILEELLRAGVAVENISACGGMAQKNPLLMQIYADVLGRPVTVCPVRQTGALGSAIYAAAAAGEEAGGFAGMEDAIRAMAPKGGRLYRPCPEAQAVYDGLYREYLRLHDYFGREDPVMHRLHGAAGQDRKV